MNARSETRRALTKSEQMGRVRTANTRPEMLLRRGLWSKGMRYRLKVSLPGKPDLVFVRQRVVVFVDGCFWHGCPKCAKGVRVNADYWLPKIANNQRRDRRVATALRKRGYRVVTIWECSLRSAKKQASIMTRLIRFFRQKSHAAAL